VPAFVGAEGSGANASVRVPRPLRGLLLYLTAAFAPLPSAACTAARNDRRLQRANIAGGIRAARRSASVGKGGATQWAGDTDEAERRAALIPEASVERNVFMGS